jgi:Zn-dependent protease
VQGRIRVKLAFYNQGMEVTVGRLPPVWAHVSLPIIAAAIAFPLWHRLDLAQVTAAAIVMVGLMLSLLAHEFGHALTARRFGLTPLRIRLHAGGGEAIMRGAAWTRTHDRLITAAGPTANVVIGLVCLLAYSILLPDRSLTGAVPPLPQPLPEPEPALFLALRWIGWLNLILAGVNLLPAFPLDGGHLFYSAIEARYGAQRALFWTGLLGTLFALYAKFLFVGGILMGVVIWSPPHLLPNWRALKSAWRRRGSTLDRQTLANRARPASEPSATADRRALHQPAGRRPRSRGTPRQRSW